MAQIVVSIGCCWKHRVKHFFSSTAAFCSIDPPRPRTCESFDAIFNEHPKNPSDQLLFVPRLPYRVQLFRRLGNRSPVLMLQACRGVSCYELTLKAECVIGCCVSASDGRECLVITSWQRRKDTCWIVSRLAGSKTQFTCRSCPPDIRQ